MANCVEHTDPPNHLGQYDMYGTPRVDMACLNEQSRATVVDIARGRYENDVVSANVNRAVSS